MTEAQTDLARRLTSNSRWTWMEGMAARCWDDRPSERVAILRTPKGLEPCWGMNEKSWYILPPTAVPDLDDFATAAILMRMAHEADLTTTTNRHSPRLVHADATVPSDMVRVWACHVAPGDKYGWIESKDLGLVAAQALLAVWEATPPPAPSTDAR